MYMKRYSVWRCKRRGLVFGAATWAGRSRYGAAFATVCKPVMIPTLPTGYVHTLARPTSTVAQQLQHKGTTAQRWLQRTATSCMLARGRAVAVLLSAADIRHTTACGGHKRPCGLHRQLGRLGRRPPLGRFAG